MEDYLGRVDGKSSRFRALVLRQNKIATRYYALDREGNATYSNAEMAARAIEAATAHAGIALPQLGFLATATTLGDVLLPGLASHTHAELGIDPIEVASFQSVCASALMALKNGYLQVKVGEHDHAAVCGSEFCSRYFRPGFYEGTDPVAEEGRVPLGADFLRFTLSDGAGAMILGPVPITGRPSFRICWIDLRSYANQFETSMIAGGTRSNGTTRYWGDFESPAAAAQAGALMLTQDFDLMKAMLPVWNSHFVDLVGSGKIVVDEIDHLCSHYSSHSLRVEAMRLMKASGCEIEEEKWFSNLYTKGNTGAASIFIMLEEFARSRSLHPGEKVLCHVPESGRSMNGFMLLEVV